jgi:hypothetical protein
MITHTVQESGRICYQAKFEVDHLSITNSTHNEHRTGTKGEKTAGS